MADNVTDAFHELEAIQDVTDAILAEEIVILREYGIKESTLTNRIGPRIHSILVSNFGSDDARGINSRTSTYQAAVTDTTDEDEEPTLPLGKEGSKTDDFVAELSAGLRKLLDAGRNVLQDVAKDVLLDQGIEALRNQKTGGKEQTGSTDNSGGTQ